jgi:hypothetical protein
MLRQEDAKESATCSNVRYGTVLLIATAEVNNGSTSNASEPR